MHKDNALIWIIYIILFVMICGPYIAEQQSRSKSHHKDKVEVFKKIKVYFCPMGFSCVGLCVNISLREYFENLKL